MIKIKKYLTKENVKQAEKVIVKVSKDVISYLIAVAGNKTVNKTVNHVVDNIRYGGDVKYDAAVGAIMSSNMTSYYKSEAIKALKRDCTAETYRAIIKMVNVSASSYYKLELIRQMMNDENS